jgi:CcmD family protein
VSNGTQYVVAAYSVIWFVLMLYVAIVGLRTSRISRELELLARLVERRNAEEEASKADAPAPSSPATRP